MAYEMKNILVNQLLDAEIKRCINEYGFGRLIDIGCGEKPYLRFVGKNITEYIGVDHPGTLHSTSKIDVFSTAYEIPFDDNSFDVALCTEVLEHLEEPQKAVIECYRLLKPSGIAIYSVPFIWHIHEEPRDFFRYSKFGLEYLFKKAGFEIIEIKALSGFWVTFGQLFVYYIYGFRRGGKLNPLWWLIPPVGLIIQLLSYTLDRINKAESWTCNYIIVARKPGR